MPSDDKPRKKRAAKKVPAIMPAVLSADMPNREAGKLNIILTCPKGFRCFQPKTGHMFYEDDLIRAGIALSPTGKLVHVPSGGQITDMFPLWNTTQADENNQVLYEGDICEVDVETGFGSVTQRIATMRWSADNNGFSLHFNGRGVYAGGVIIKACRKLGNEYQDKDAAQRYLNDNS